MSSEEKGAAGLSTPEKEGKENALPAFNTEEPELEQTQTRRHGESFFTRTGLSLNSFKRRDGEVSAVDELDRSLRTRHMHMIAIGGSIGAGFFVGSGGALSKGGPGSLFLDFLIIGIMMFNTVYALGELAVMYPVSGSFYTYSTRFIDPAWGFAMGWNYVMQWAVVLPLELTVCGFTVGYWNPDINVGESHTVVGCGMTSLAFGGREGW